MVKEEAFRQKLGDRINDCVNRQSFTPTDLDQILALIALIYVKLASDQRTPLIPAYYYSVVDNQGKTNSKLKQESYAVAQQDMLKAGWRKVELVGNL